LNSFFVNRFPGSFARGIPFQDNPKTGDCRISGTTASLAGLEAGDAGAIGRILLAHSIVLSTGGIPLLYLGDEVGQLNDPHWADEPGHADDSRWAHRPTYPAERYAQRTDAATDAGRIYSGLQHLIAVRRATPEFSGGTLIGFDTKNDTAEIPVVTGLPAADQTRQLRGVVGFTVMPEQIFAMLGVEYGSMGEGERFGLWGGALSGGPGGAGGSGRRQRARIVGTRRPGAWHMMKNGERAGGSSSTLGSALAALAFMSSAGSTIATAAFASGRETEGRGRTLTREGAGRALQATRASGWGTATATTKPP